MNHSNAFNELQANIIDIESFYRRGEESAGSWYFQAFTTSLERYISARGLGNNPELNNILNVMFDAQQRRDNLFFADLLRYELLPLIELEAQKSRELNTTPPFN